MIHSFFQLCSAVVECCSPGRKGLACLLLSQIDLRLDLLECMEKTEFETVVKGPVDLASYRYTHYMYR